MFLTDVDQLPLFSYGVYLLTSLLGFILKRDDISIENTPEPTIDFQGTCC